MNGLNNSIESNSYEFDAFTLSGALKELRRGEEGIEIQRRVLDLLTFLIENRDRTVSKEELQEAVWPGTIVTEAALTRAIMKARKALDDDASEPKYIKTVHGQGYRFVAEVHELTDTADAPQIDVKARRNALLRVATTYGAGAWLINQAAAMVWEAFEWDRWPQQALLAVSLLGFPLVLAVAWFYRATPSGVALRTEKVREAASETNNNWQRWVIATLGIALSLSVAWNVRESVETDVTHTELRVGVLPVANLTENSELDWISLGMMSLINTQLREADIGIVSSRAMLQELEPETTTLTEESVALLRKTQALGMSVSLAVQARGAEFEVTGFYGDQTQRFELPTFGGQSPAEAVRRMGDHLIKSLKPTNAIDADFESVGDVFVDQVFARAMYELLSGNLQRAKEMLIVASNAAPDSFWPNYELNVVLRNLGEFDEALARNLALLDIARTQSNPVQVAVLSNELGVIYDLTGELDKSERAYLEGLEWAEQGGAHDREAVLLINYATLERARSNPLRARELLGRAVTAYDDAGIEMLPGDFYITLGNAAADAGDYRGAREQYQQGLTNYRAMQRPQGEGLALSNLSWASEQLGEMDAAIAYLEESQALRERIGDTPGILKSQSRRADLFYSLGRLDEVIRIATEIEAHEYAQKERELLTNAWNYRAFVALEREEYAQAHTLFADAYTLDLEDGRVYSQVRAKLGVVEALLGLDQISQARSELENVQDALGAEQISEFKLQAQRLNADIAWRQGQRETALTALRETIDTARRIGNNRQLGLTAVQLANFYAELNQTSDMESWTGVAVETLPGHGEVQIARAKLAIARKQYDEVEAYLTKAETAMGERVADEVLAIRTLLSENALVEK